MTPLIPFAIVVEDDPSWQQILSEILSDCGLEVQITSNLDDAVLALKAKPHRLAIVDLSLSPNDHNNHDGLRVLDAVRRLDPNCRTILLTGFSTVELAVSALTNYGAFTFLRKENFHRGQFREIVYRALATAHQPDFRNSADETSDERFTKSKLPLNVSPSNIIPAGIALVVEDDAGWRSILEELLIDAKFNVRACASYGEALGYLRREKFSLAVVDLSLNGTVESLWDQKISSENLGGFQLLASTRAGGVPTIVVSGVASPEDIKRAYAEQSIYAYLEKQAFDRITFIRIIEEARKAHRSESELGSLTNREREILDLLALGLTNKEIADKLFITSNTVKRHLKAVFEKLNVHTRSAAAAKTHSDR